MGLRKRFRDFRVWCPQPPDRFPAKLKHYSAPIAIVLAATLVSVSVFAVSSNLLFDSAAVKTLPILPLSSQTSGTFGFSEVISKDTTWTAANSPVNFPGNVLVTSGVTLTIEAGVTVNFFQYIMQVNGTLNVQGTPVNMVNFTDTNREVADVIHDQSAAIDFGDSSVDDAIQYTTFDAMSLTYYNCNSTIILNDDVFQSQSYSTTSGGGFVGLMPTIRGSGYADITNNVFTGSIQDDCAVSTIANNTFTNGGADTDGGSLLILNNTFTGDGSVDSGFGLTIGYREKAVVSDNRFTGFSEACIDLATSSSAWIQRNLIENRQSAGSGYPFFGIEVEDTSPVIENNTITGCNIGIDVYSYDSGSLYSAVEATPIIKNNNIYNNAEYNLFLGYPERSGYNTLNYIVGNINASSNWWGTTEPQAINQTIRDIKDQSNLGTANFTPFLTASNPQATPNPAAPTPTIMQIPTVTVLDTTIGTGEKVDVTVNGNFSIGLATMSNSTATQSNSTTNIAFTISGDASENSFANITIPKSAVTFGKTPTIYVGNQKASNQGYVQDADNYYVWGTTHFNGGFYGSLTITFSNASSLEITVGPIIVGVIIVVAGAILVLAYRRKKRTTPNLQGIDEKSAGEQ